MSKKMKKQVEGSENVGFCQKTRNGQRSPYVSQHPLTIPTVVDVILTYLIPVDDTGRVNIMSRHLKNYQQLGPVWYKSIDLLIGREIPFKLGPLRSPKSVQLAVKQVKPYQCRFFSSAMSSITMIPFCSQVGHQMTFLELNLTTKYVSTLLGQSVSILSRFCPNLRTLSVLCRATDNMTDDELYNLKDPPPSPLIYDQVQYPSDTEDQMMCSNQIPVFSSLPVTNLLVNYCYVDDCADNVEYILYSCHSIRSLTISHTSSDMVMTILHYFATKEPIYGLEQLETLRLHQLENLEELPTKVWIDGQPQFITSPSDDYEVYDFLNYFTNSQWFLRHLELSTAPHLSLSAIFVSRILSHLSTSDCLTHLHLDLDCVHYEPGTKEMDKIVVPTSLTKLTHLTVIGRVTPTALFLVQALQLLKLEYCEVHYTGKEVFPSFGALWQEFRDRIVVTPNVKGLSVNNLAMATGNNKIVKYPVAQWDPCDFASIFIQQPNPWGGLKEVELRHVSHTMLRGILNGLRELERVVIEGLYVERRVEGEGGVDWDEVFTGVKKDGGKEERVAEVSITNLTCLKSLQLKRNGLLTNFFIENGLMKLNGLQYVAVENHRFTRPMIAKLQAHAHPMCRLNF